MGQSQAKEEAVAECPPTDQVTNYLDKNMAKHTSAVGEAMARSTALKSVMPAIDRLAPFLESQKQQAATQQAQALTMWKSTYYPDTRDTTEGMTEGMTFDSAYIDSLIAKVAAPAPNLQIPIEASIRAQIKNRQTALYSYANKADCETNIKTTMTSFLKAEKADLERLNTYMKGLTDSFRVLYQNSIANNAIALKAAQLNGVDSQIHKLTQDLYMDERRDKYVSKNLEFYTRLYFYLLILYYGLFAVYVVFSNFLSDSLYLIPMIQVIIVVYLGFPWALPYILWGIYKAYIFVLEYRYMK